MTALNDLERKVLEAALTGSGTILAALREQAARCRVVARDHTGVGFFTRIEVAGEPSQATGSAAIGGVFGEIEGLENGAGFVVFIESGKLNAIEGFTYGEPWPARARALRLFPPSGAPDISGLSGLGAT